MAEHKVSVNNTGIESAGLTNDYMEAISEFIWNSFDAKSSCVSIEFETNEIDHLYKVSIIDNGEGIAFTEIDQTFGSFMDSIKKVSYKKSSSLIRGHRGKGRFAFIAFSGLATWNTTYLDEESNKYLNYELVIRKNSKDKFYDNNKVISKIEETGTKVTFTELFGVSSYSFSNEQFINFLRREFGWFLFLNKEKEYCVKINGGEIDYSPIIAESEVKDVNIDSAGNKIPFKVTYVRWKEKIGEKFYFYFLNSEQKEVSKQLTSFNNNAIDFNHSVYIESPFFDNFTIDDSEKNLTLFSSAKNSGVFKVLMSTLQKFLKEKQKEYVNEVAAKKLIDTFERNGAIPAFGSNKYAQAKKKDLIDVVKGLYCIEPKIFKGLNKEQQKVSIGLINLLLDTDERNTIIELIGKIVQITKEERENLLGILKNTSLAKVSKMVNMVEQRFKIIELLRTLVYDLKKFTSEIKHLQKAIEENYWIFGEEYHLVSANESFSTLHKMYMIFIDDLEEKDKKNNKNFDSKFSNRRPDVFVCKKRTIPDAKDNLNLMEENLMIELKRPTVVIGKEQVRQIEDYLDLVITDDRFNSRKRTWKFFLIGNKVDEHIENLYESERGKGKLFLIKGVKNFEIYAFTWDDIFLMFELRHKFIIENLEFDKESIKRELIEKGIDITGIPVTHDMLKASKNLLDEKN